MLLRRQLLRRELQHAHQFLSIAPGVLEAERVQADFANHGVVRNHHRAWSEERFEVVGELSTASVARVHGNEHVTVVIEAHVGSLEVEHFLLLTLGLVDHENLLGDH